MPGTAYPKELSPDQILAKPGPAVHGSDAKLAEHEDKGFVRRTECRSVAADYVKTLYGWTIARVEFTAA